MIGIREVAWSFPDSRVTAAQYAALTKTEEAWALKKTGVSERYFLAPGEDEVDLAVKAFTKLRAKITFRDADLDLLIYVTQNPDRTMPHAAAQLLDRLQFKGLPASFDISLGCSAYPYALAIAQGMMEAQSFRNAVIVTNDPYSRITTSDDSKTSAIFGDGASATFLERDKGGAIGKGSFGTDGAGWNIIHLPKISEGLVSSSFLGSPAERHSESRTLRMNGSRLVSYFGQIVPKVIYDTLLRNNLDYNDIDVLILHQASLLMLETLKKKLPFSAKTDIPILISNNGNTASSSVPIALGQVMEDGVIEGKTVLLCGYGVGLSWSAIILKF